MLREVGCTANYAGSMQPKLGLTFLATTSKIFCEPPCYGLHLFLGHGLNRSLCSSPLSGCCTLNRSCTRLWSENIGLSLLTDITYVTFHRERSPHTRTLVASGSGLAGITLPSKQLLHGVVNKSISVSLSCRDKPGLFRPTVDSRGLQCSSTRRLEGPVPPFV